MVGQQAGATIGPYRVLEQVGLGGMATVYKAYQPAMDRYVALKILPQHYAQDPQFVERFLREARTIANLEHRNILPVYDFGEDRGITYLAMRYLEGGTLKDILALGQLTLADAGQLLGQVAHALDYAHRQGVVHRDVKPANIMVDNEGWTYLTDFGIAKVLDTTSELTAGAIGTPAYMAPEQSLGQPVDGRADIYALGVILYELVTGQVPFKADTPMAVALAHIHEPLPPPRSVDPSVPESFERVILKALAKDPDDRYQAAAAFDEALDEAIHAAEVDITFTQIDVLAKEARQSREMERRPVNENFLTEPMDDGATAETEQIPETSPQTRTPAWVWPVVAVAGLVIVGALVLLGINLINPGALSSEEGPDVADQPAAAATGTPDNVPTEEVEAAPAEPANNELANLPEWSLEPSNNILTVQRCQDADEGDTGLCIIDAQTGQVETRVLANEVFPDGYFAGAALSPDAQRLAIAWERDTEANPQEVNNDLWIVGLDGTVEQAIDLGGNVVEPTWSPDGEWIAMHWSGDLAIVHPDGSGFEVLHEAQGFECAMVPGWSPDGRSLVAGIQSAGVGCEVIEGYRVRIFNVADGGWLDAAEITFSDPGECHPNVAFSPDNMLVSYIGQNCEILLARSDGQGTVAALQEFPWWWHDFTYPRWNRPATRLGSIVFADDFDDENLNEWDFTGHPVGDTAENWSIVTEESVDGAINRVAQANPTAEHIEIGIVPRGLDVTNYAVGYRVRLMEPIPEANPGNHGQSSYYQKSGNCHYGLQLSETGNHLWIEPDTCPQAQEITRWTGIEAGGWHTVLVEMYEGQIAVYIDGDLVHRGEGEPTVTEPFVSINSIGTVLQVDEVRVWELVTIDGGG